jgi:hypothetical protein
MISGGSAGKRAHRLLYTEGGLDLKGFAVIAVA